MAAGEEVHSNRYYLFFTTLTIAGVFIMYISAVWDRHPLIWRLPSSPLLHLTTAAATMFLVVLLFLA